MPTASDRAYAEQKAWERIAAGWAGQAISEKAIVVFFDPSEDLAGRGREWQYEFARDDLATLAVFAAGLCNAEARGWEFDDPALATRAYEARRFLLADRIIHWAVPWLDAMGRAHSEFLEPALRDRDFLLDLGDEMRVAPTLSGGEGLRLQGEDSFGPLDQGAGVTGSLWSGAVILAEPVDLAGHYQDAALLWEQLAEDHPGSAQLWTDLAGRARRSEAAATRP